MFEFITNTEERGQVGIGTLIVFIAMVLVAAIAAGVLINTAGFLQTQAEATGEDSTDLVSERIDVNSEVGIVSGDALSEIRLSVAGAPGAGQIDLSETTIQAVGPGGQENLVFTSTADGASEVTQLSVPAIADQDTEFDVTINYDNIDSLDAADNDQELVVEFEGEDSTTDTVTVTGNDLDGETFSATDGGSGDADIDVGGTEFSTDDEITVRLLDADDENVLEEDVIQIVDEQDGAAESTTLEGGNSVDNLGPNEFAVGSDGDFYDSPVLDEETDYTILINPDSGAFEDSGAFGEGQQATLDIVSPAGATTQVELRAPDLFNENGEAVRL